MATHANVHFTENGQPMANVYVNSDGYPDSPTGMIARLEQFFADVEDQTSETRFLEASYLAAKYVVWMAGRTATEGKPLEFRGVGVAVADAADGSYVYRVECGHRSRRLHCGRYGWPVVTWRKA